MDAARGGQGSEGSSKRPVVRVLGLSPRNRGRFVRCRASTLRRCSGASDTQRIDEPGSGNRVVAAGHADKAHAHVGQITVSENYESRSAFDAVASRTLGSALVEQAATPISNPVSPAS